MNKILKDRVKLIRSIQTALKEDFSEPAKKVISELITTIRQDKNYHFLSISQERNGRISYAQCPAHKLDNNKRIRSTFRRYVRRQLKTSAESFSDKSLFKLGGIVVGKTISHDDLNGRIQILEGEDITDFYQNTEIESCMTGSNSWKVKLYAENPDNVKLIVLDEDVARALLWKTDDGTMVLDRIYPQGCDSVGLLQNWAANKGYIFRSSTAADDIELSDEKYYEITLTHSGNFPFMDTFRHGEDLGNGKIIVSNQSYFGDFELTNTNGGHSELYRCSCCNGTMSNDDRYTAFDETYCQDCFYDRFFYCSQCGYEVRNDDRITIGDEDFCEECANKLFVSCEDCSEYFEEEKLATVNLSNGSSALVCCDCLDEYSLCSGCLEYFENKDMSEINDENYCSCCTEKIAIETEELIAA